MFIFHDPWVLSLIILAPFLILFSLTRRTRAGLRFSSEDILKEFKPTARIRLSKIFIFTRAIAAILIILSLARPQAVLSQTKTVTEGVDIVLGIDTSSSMLAEDFKMGAKRINRFEVVKDAVKDFIKKREGDRIAMVAFAARAYTVCPLTTDYAWLYENLDRVKVGMMEDATAVGSSLATSLSRLETSKTKSKIIVLLTDGINNAGNISPLTAAEAAKALKVKIYTIAVGSKGLVPYPFKDVYGRTVYQNIPIEIDEDSMRKIAEKTGGKYYLASDSETLKRIYEDINRLEKSTIERFGYKEYTELFPYFLIPGLIVLALEIFLSNTLFLKVP